MLGTIKKHIAFVCACMVFTCLLPACGARQQTDAQLEPTDTLTVCVEQVYYADFRALLSYFQRENMDIHLTIEQIPTMREDASGNFSTTEREAYLAGLRASMLAGSGPDIFFLHGYRPNGGYDETFMGGATAVSYNEEQLFDDIIYTMQAGMFADLEPLLEYAGIDTSAYLQPVLAAGRWQDTQYVLPISFKLLGFLFAKEEYLRAAPPGQGGLQAFYDDLARYDDRVRDTWYPGIPALLAQQAVDYDSFTMQTDRDLHRYILEHNSKLLEWAEGRDHGLAPDAAGYGDSYIFSTMGRNPLSNLRVYAQTMQGKGMGPVLVPTPDAAGGVSVQIAAYAAVFAGSPNKANAAKLLEFMLRPDSILESNNDVFKSKTAGSSGNGYVPVNTEYWPWYFGDVYSVFQPLEETITAGVFVSQMVADSYMEATQPYFDGARSASEALEEWERLLGFRLEELR